MISYGPLAAKYDELTTDVDYSRYADLYEAEFRRNGGEFRLLLDLCCGTGTLTMEMTRRGYEMIAADASIEMLMQAQSKDYPGVRPLFLCQRAEELDLYGTVDAAFSSLDSINYIPGDKLEEIFRRLHLFIRPGGIFIFDIRSPEWLKSLDGELFIDETDSTFCTWRAELDEQQSKISYGIDIFSLKGKLWSRDSEEHTEYIHEPEVIARELKNNGFEKITFIRNGPDCNNGRLFICAERNNN